MSGRKGGSYVVVGSGKSPRDGVFREVRMPDGSLARGMNKFVFEKAVGSADRKIRSYTTRIQKKETPS